MNDTLSTPMFPWDRYRASWKQAATLRAFSNPEAAEYVLTGEALEKNPALRAQFEEWYRTSPEFREGVERDITTFLPAPPSPAK